MSSFALYFMLMLDNIHNLFMITAAVAGLAVVVFWISTDSAYEERRLIAVKRAKTSMILMIASLLLLALTPTTKQMAAIIIVPEILKNEKVQQLPNEVMELLGMGVDKAKELLSHETKGETN